MKANHCLPIFQLTRGETVESIHFGAIAVVDVFGKLVAHYGDPETITFLRSSAKPFQAMPFLANGGQEYYHLSQDEIAVLCASHSGTDLHVATVQSIQAKANLSEADLLCGVHEPGDEATAEKLRQHNEQPGSLRHNCSGKHTGMLAYAQMTGRKYTDLAYIAPQHPIQAEILQNFAEMCNIPVEQVDSGVDGCSAPNFAVPLHSTAYAYARLCDPVTGGVLPAQRVRACQLITAAMTGSPMMVAGPGKFDTCLMQVTRGKLVCKGGAEGYTGVGLMPGLLAPGSPALGIALKISDGDARGKVRSAVVLEVLIQLGVLSEAEQLALAGFGPSFTLENWRKIRVGRGSPCFELIYDA